jgi:hypothetical protein
MKMYLDWAGLVVSLSFSLPCKHLGRGVRFIFLNHIVDIYFFIYII